MDPAQRMAAPALQLSAPTHGIYPAPACIQSQRGEEKAEKCAFSQFKLAGGSTRPPPLELISHPHLPTAPLTTGLAARPAMHITLRIWSSCPQGKGKSTSHPVQDTDTTANCTVCLESERVELRRPTGHYALEPCGWLPNIWLFPQATDTGI